MTAGAGLLLGGLDGANPLGFVAALGALRGLTIAWPERAVRLSWDPGDGWRPRVHVDAAAPTPGDLLDGLGEFARLRPGHEALCIARDLTIRSGDFRGFRPFCDRAHCHPGHERR